MTKLKKYNTIQEWNDAKLDYPSVGLIKDSGEVVYYFKGVKYVLNMTTRQEGYRSIFGIAPGTTISNILVDGSPIEFSINYDDYYYNEYWPYHYDNGIDVCFDLSPGDHIIEIRFSEMYFTTRFFRDWDFDLHSFDVYGIKNSSVVDLTLDDRGFYGCKLTINDDISQVNCLHVPQEFSEFTINSKLNPNLIFFHHWPSDAFSYGEQIFRYNGEYDKSIRSIWQSLPTSVRFDPPVPSEFTGITEDMLEEEGDNSVGGFRQIYKAGYIDTWWTVPEESVGVEGVIMPGELDQYTIPNYNCIYKVTIDDVVVCEKSVYDYDPLFSKDTPLCHTFDAAGSHNIKFYVYNTGENPYIDTNSFFQGVGNSFAFLDKIDLSNVTASVSLSAFAAWSSVVEMDFTGVDVADNMTCIDAARGCPRLEKIVYTGHYSQMYGEGGYTWFGWSPGEAPNPGIIYYNGRYETFLINSMNDCAPNWMWLPVNDVRWWFPNYDNIEVGKNYPGFFINGYQIASYLFGLLNSGSGEVEVTTNEDGENEIYETFITFQNSEYFIEIDGVRDEFKQFYLLSRYDNETDYYYVELQLIGNTYEVKISGLDYSTFFGINMVVNKK